MPINYLKGDATRPVLAPEEKVIICHCCNDLGVWGKGFVLALSRRWKAPEEAYRKWSKGQKGELPFELGQVQFVGVAPNLWVANLIGQHGVGKKDGVPPIRYEALREGLGRVARFALSQKASVHLPRIGSGLAGGEWSIISQLIETELVGQGVSVTVYDLN